MTLIGTTPLTRYPRLHPDMGYLRTIISPAPSPMTLNDLLISNFQATHESQRDPRPREREIWASNYRLCRLSLHCCASACDLTNATLPLGQFPEI